MADRFTYRSVRWGAGSGIGDAVKILLLLNGIGFLLQQIAGPSVTWNLGLVPYLAWSKLRVWQFATYLFMHGGLFHILFNMYALWAFGSELEHSWGFREFLKYYFICGIGAGIFHTAITPHSVVPTIGASGAVAGVLVGYAVMYPERELQLLLFFVIPVQMKAKVLALGYAFLSLVLGSFGSPDGIAHFAHLGGMLVGFVYLKFGIQRKSPGRWLADWRRKRKFRLARREQASRDAMEDSVNEALDRLNQVGFDALSSREKRTLEQASQFIKKRTGKKRT
jgi:membrane associated rhomboid family serine protease